MPHPLEDLIAKTSLGDRKAFRELYLATSAKLFGVCLRVLKDRAQAEEALQEVYIKIWQKASSFAANTYSPMSWLVVIARNHAIDILRAKHPEARTLEDMQETGEELASDGQNPEEAALLSSEGRSIAACMEELERQKAEAVRLAYVDGYSYQELADRFSVPLNTMRTWLRRSLNSLKECLER